MRRASANAPLPHVAPSDVAQLLYTSGTTGRPKGALLTHRAPDEQRRLAFGAVGVGPDDLLVNPMPLFHVGGVMFTLGAVSATAAHVLMPRFSPALQLELIETYRATLLLGVPTMMLAMLGHPDLAERDVSVAAPRDQRRRRSRRPPWSAGSRSELGLCYSIVVRADRGELLDHDDAAADSADDRAETVGRPLPTPRSRIADLATGATAACGAVGEICTRGYLVMRCYLNAPEATAAAVDADGWLHTGDLGSMDERGYLRIAGPHQGHDHPRRREHLPARDRSGADRPPGCGRRLVLGFPDEHYGETVAAAIRPAGPDPGVGDLADELAEFCRARLAAYKVPIRWLITDAFPLTASGKVRKDALRDQLAERSPA